MRLPACELSSPTSRKVGAADALTERLHARVVVFANFPQPDKEAAFDDLVRRNLAALLNAGESGEKRP